MGSREGEGPNEWDSGRYDDTQSYVFEYGEDVVELLEPKEGERVLDLGCGTGHLTNLIRESGAEAVGLDSSEEMIRKARANHPEVRFVRADARSFEFDEVFDAVFSNAALHWIEEGNQGDVLESVSRAVRPGGRFVAELGGKGNIDVLLDGIRSELAERGYEYDDPFYFPSLGEYASELEEKGFEVRYATLFDRPTELNEGEEGLAVWMDTFCDSFLSSLSEDRRHEVVSGVEERLRDELFEDGSWVIGHRRLRFVAVNTAE
ncbi:MAG: methyltransferase domain-containing protein [Halobacteria archaeon]|nr:methyltransferase domain-containing protein [Halobacteria archaeon]